MCVCLCDACVHACAHVQAQACVNLCVKYAGMYRTAYNTVFVIHMCFPFQTSLIVLNLHILAKFGLLGHFTPGNGLPASYFSDAQHQYTQIF